MTADPGLYDRDLNAWAEDQTRALREDRREDLDRDHLALVIGGLGLRQRRELRSRLGVILTGLLRWVAQVDLRSHGWAVTLDHQRHDVETILADNPSLRDEVPMLIARIYPVAKRRAVLESSLFDESFPESCPFTTEEILREGHYPDPYGDDAVRGEGWWKRSP